MMMPCGLGLIDRKWTTKDINVAIYAPIRVKIATRDTKKILTN